MSSSAVSISLEQYASPSLDTSESIHLPLLSNHHSKHIDHSLLLSDHPELSRLDNRLNPSKRRKWYKNHWILILFIFLISLLGLYGLHKLNVGRRFISPLMHSDLNQQDRILDEMNFPERLIKSNTICSYCDCQKIRTSPPLLNFDNLFINSSNTNSYVNRKSILNHVWLSIRDIYCRHAWLGEGPALDLLEETDIKRDIQTYIQWRLEKLEVGVPTAYLFTKTSWAGRTKHLRYAYFKRHILTIRTHLDIMKHSKWPVKEENQAWGEKRQLIWIIVEDGEKLANDVAQELVNTDVPYIYFTYGPTHHFGNAQQNAAYSLIHRLSDSSMGGIFGHGPVMSIDDDSNFLPELLVMIWKTKRIGVWPMGNLGPHGWEGPVYDPVNHTLISWEAGAVQDRKFPVDNGAFAFSSHLLGSVIKGPRYWPTDISGGENEFIKLIIDKKEDLEPLCYNCHVAWHNEPLPPACTDLQICP